MQRKWHLNAHLLLMLVLSTVIAYLVVDQLVPSASSAYKSSFVFGRGLGSILFAVILVAIPSGIHRLIKHERLPHYVPVLWFVWVVIIALSTYGAVVVN